MSGIDNLKYLGHGNAGLVLLTRNGKQNKQLIKFIPCLTRTDCISVAGYEGLCTSSVASTNLPFFPSSPEKILTLTPEEFKTQWYSIFQKNKFPLPKRWKQNDPDATWLNRDWHVLVIYSKEYLHDKIEFYKNRSLHDQLYILLSILAAIQNAQFYFQMIHGDLHIKNIMVRKHPENEKRHKKLIFRKSPTLLYEIDFGEMDYDVVLVDWEKATSSKLFGYKSVHAHLQRMFPVFFKHKVNIVPCEWIDIDYVFQDLVPSLFSSEETRTSIQKIQNSVENKNYMYPFGIYPVSYIYTMKDPLWISLLAQGIVELARNKLNHSQIKDASFSNFMMPSYNNTLLPPWTSKQDFLQHFMQEYFTFKKPMHQYMLPPFAWETQQFRLLRDDFKKMHNNFDICPWPTSIPRPILYSTLDQKKNVKVQDIVATQLLVLEIYFDFDPTSSSKKIEISKNVMDEIKAIRQLEKL